MTITYTFTQKELFRWMWRRQLREYRSFLLWMLPIGIGIVWTGSGFTQFLGVVLLLWAIGAPLQERTSISQRIDEDEYALGPLTIDIDEQGLKYARPNWKAEMPWSFFNVVNEDDAFICVSRKTSGNPLLLVPKRAFGSTEEMEAFRQIVNEGVTKRS